MPRLPGVSCHGSRYGAPLHIGTRPQGLSCCTCQGHPPLELKSLMSVHAVLASKAPSFSASGRPPAAASRLHPPHMLGPCPYPSLAAAWVHLRPLAGEPCEMLPCHHWQAAPPSAFLVLCPLRDEPFCPLAGEPREVGPDLHSDHQGPAPLPHLRSLTTTCDSVLLAVRCTPCLRPSQWCHVAPWRRSGRPGQVGGREEESSEGRGTGRRGRGGGCHREDTDCHEG